MKKLILISISILVFFNAQSQDSLEMEFDKARVLLAKRNIEEAIKSLRKVYVSQPENANINFLMGAAYTELVGTQGEALFHLKKAVQNVNEKYIIGSFKENGSPIHVYYYLTIALVEVDSCAEAAKALIEFKKHSERVDGYFIDEASRHLQKCPYAENAIADNWNEVIPPPENYDPTFIEEEEKIELDTAALANRGILTKRLEYTTKAALYGVQIGSNLNPSPISSFGEVKNVDVFIDNEGIIRYVIGHFVYRKQADRLLETLQEKGYKDAFVVNVNDERKYSNEVISYNNVNLRAGIRGTVEYYVQLGAFKESIPDNLMQAYTEISGIEEIVDQDMTMIVLGPFEKYSEAVNHKNGIDESKISDAFIVAFNKGKRIPLNDAINHTE